jgi:hypothetical protein
MQAPARTHSPPQGPVRGHWPAGWWLIPFCILGLSCWGLALAALVA